MATIRLLDEKTINKIAAGEVVERPASVIKELVENAIDAGSTSIEVEIAEGGIAYMRVSDNGVGMSEEDARLAVLRHATSKIESVDDLYHIASLGFRGEALASIASVSKFSLSTRLHDAELGTRILIEGGHMMDCLPCGTAPGTTIEVKDLFFNTPARRKFLKTPRTESLKIQDIMGKIALSHPHIAFKCIIDTKVAIMTPGTGTLLDSVSALYGYKVSEDVFPVQYEAEGVVIEGVVSKPSLLKSNRMWQTIIVNQRVIADKAIFKAMDNAYHALLPKGGYPLIVLHIIVPPDTVDINVHPRKSEVKFADDKPIYKAVYHSILQALNDPHSKDSGHLVEQITHSPTSLTTKDYSIVREKTDQFVESLRNDGYQKPIRTSYEQSSLEHIADGFTAQRGARIHHSYTQEDRDALKALRQGAEVPTISYDQSIHSSQSLVKESNFNEEIPEELQGLLPLGQVSSLYIIAKKDDQLYIIDQHAAHERIRYDALCASAEAIPSQELLLPQFMDANVAELTAIEEQEQALWDLGFHLSQGGPTQIRINALPVDLLESKGEEVIRYILNFLQEQQEVSKAQLRHEMLAYASCRGAIKGGHKLNTYQMANLINDLLHTKQPYVCPHGRPTMIKFSPHELGKLFLRL